MAVTGCQAGPSSAPRDQAATGYGGGDRPKVAADVVGALQTVRRRGRTSRAAGGHRRGPRCRSSPPVPLSSSVADHMPVWPASVSVSFGWRPAATIGTLCNRLLLGDPPSGSGTALGQFRRLAMDRRGSSVWCQRPPWRTLWSVQRGSQARRTADGAPDAWQPALIRQPWLHDDGGHSDVDALADHPAGRGLRQRRRHGAGVGPGRQGAAVPAVGSPPGQGQRGRGRGPGRPPDRDLGRQRPHGVGVGPGGGTTRGAPLAGHDGWVLAVAIGELGGRPIAVSGGLDDTVRMWDLAAGGPLGGPLAHDGFVNAVALGELHDRSLAASSDAAETVRPVVATALPGAGREAAMTLGSRRVDQGGNAGSWGSSSGASGRRHRRAAPARGLGAVTIRGSSQLRV